MAAPEPKEQGGGAEAAPQAAAQGGGISTGLFLGVAGGVTVLLLGAGYAIAQFVLVPGAVKALEARQAAAHAEAPAAEGHGEKEKPAAKEGEKKTEKKDEKSSEGEKKEGKEEKAKEGEAKGKEGAKEGGKEGAKEAVPKDFILSEIYVNIKGTRGTRILKASLFFDAPKGLIPKLEEERPKIIDIVSQILASKTLDQLNAEDIRGVLKDDIMGKVNAILGGNTVQNIYFLDFVVQ